MKKKIEIAEVNKNKIFVDDLLTTVRIHNTIVHKLHNYLHNDLFDRFLKRYKQFEEYRVSKHPDIYDSPVKLEIEKIKFVLELFANLDADNKPIEKYFNFFYESSFIHDKNLLLTMHILDKKEMVNFLLSQSIFTIDKHYDAFYSEFGNYHEIEKYTKISTKEKANRKDDLFNIQKILSIKNKLDVNLNKKDTNNKIKNKI